MRICAVPATSHDRVPLDRRDVLAAAGWKYRFIIPAPPSSRDPFAVIICRARRNSLRDVDGPRSIFCSNHILCTCIFLRPVSDFIFACFSGEQIFRRLSIRRLSPTMDADQLYTRKCSFPAVRRKCIARNKTK